MCGWDRAKGRNIQAVETLGKSVVRPSEVRQADLYSLANAFHLPSLSYAIETTNQESCSTSYSGVAVPVPPGGLPWSQLGSRPFEPSGLAAVNADATVTGIQVLQGGCE
jgi:hypothetical protein